MGFIEGIFRVKIPVIIQTVLTYIFAILLILLMLFVSFHDIYERSDIFIDMFNSDTEVQAPADPTPAASE